jgi:peptide/nickel transport system substrate-binding protein
MEASRTSSSTSSSPTKKGPSIRSLTQHLAIGLIALTWMSVAGCRHQDDLAARSQSATLTIGQGLDAGARLQQVLQILTEEGLLTVNSHGRLTPWLAESWTSSDDGLRWTFKLRSGVTFHDGTLVSAEGVRTLLLRELPEALGPAFQNIKSIDAPSPTELTIDLKRRSMFLPEALGLNMPIHAPDSTAGTGPFYLAQQERNSAELRSNEHYYQGRPFIDRIVIKPYTSVRSAWADLLRGQVDMVYEVGIDAFDSVAPATGTKIFTYKRPYAFVIVLNLRTPALQKPEFRRALNMAINRDELVAEALDGHGRPASGPVWPDHWTYDESFPSFKYEPESVATNGHRPTFTCLYSEPSYEKLALFVQRELRAVGVDMRLEFTPVAEGFARANAGDFDAWLADLNLAPSLFRQSLFWRSDSPYNWGHYQSAKVEAALDAMDQARNDADYRDGAEAFQRAIIADPPGIFLAWSDRLRAVSTRFEVHEEPGRDIINTLRLWRPLGAMPRSTN